MKKLLYLSIILPSIIFADSKVSNLTEQLSPKSTDYMYIVANSTSMKVSLSSVFSSNTVRKELNISSGTAEIKLKSFYYTGLDNTYNGLIGFTDAASSGALYLGKSSSDNRYNYGISIGTNSLGGNYVSIGKSDLSTASQYPYIGSQFVVDYLNNNLYFGSKNLQGVGLIGGIGPPFSSLFSIYKSSSSDASSYIACFGREYFDGADYLPENDYCFDGEKADFSNKLNILNQKPIRFYNSGSSKYISFSSSETTTYNQDYILPDSTGTTNQALGINGQRSDGKVSLWWMPVALLNSTQTFSGSNTFNNMAVNNTSGLPFAGTSGIPRLIDSNMKVGPVTNTAYFAGYFATASTGTTDNTGNTAHFGGLVARSSDTFAGRTPGIALEGRNDARSLQPNVQQTAILSYMDAISTGTVDPTQSFFSNRVRTCMSTSGDCTTEVNSGNGYALYLEPIVGFNTRVGMYQAGTREYNIIMGSTTFGTTVAPGANSKVWIVQPGGASVTAGLMLLGGTVSDYTYLGIGRTSNDYLLGVSASANQFLTGNAAGDAFIGTNAGTNRLAFSAGLNKVPELAVQNGNVVVSSTFTLMTSTIVINGTTYYASMGTGSNGQVLTTNGAAKPTLSWTTVSGSGGVTVYPATSTISMIKVDDGNTGASKTIDWTQGNIHVATMTSNCTFTFTDPATPARLTLKLIQDSTGSRTATWPASVKWPSAVSPTLTTTATTGTDIVTCLYDGGNYQCTASLDFR